MTTPVEPDAEPTPSLSISLASPIDIRSWSYGGIETDELFDYEHRRFHPAGLFSERIFGPIRDYQCACGKFFGADNSGVVCDECSVSLRPRIVRSQRMAHIGLPVPIVHPWFWGHDQAPLELLSGLSHQQLQRLVARRRFIQLETSPPHLRSSLCSATTAQAEGGSTLDGFLDRSGGDAVRRLLGRIDFATLLQLLDDRLDGEASASRQCRLAEMRLDPEYVAGVFRQSGHLRKRVELVRQIVRSSAVPQDAVLEVLPVIPAGLRTGEVAADGRLVVDDITARYQRILRWRHAIQQCLDRMALEQNAWPTAEARRRLVRYERRLAAEIAGLFDNLLHRGSAASQVDKVRDRRRRWPGKRVDFSARSVVVPDPSLRMFECRLPRKKIAEVLFEPLTAGVFGGSKIAVATLESEATKHPLVFSFLPADESCNLVSLHPRLTEDKATHVHPLVAAAVERSFGDLEAIIHLPLSEEAEADCDRLSFPAAHMRDAISGDCKVRIAGDAAVGCYYASWLSEDRRTIRDKVLGGKMERPAEVHSFRSLADVQVAWEAGRAHVHDLAEVRLAAGRPLIRSLSDRVDVSAGKRRAWTTVGRALVNRLLPAGSPYYDVPLDEPSLHAMLLEVLESNGALWAERFVERASALGLQVLTRAGLSLSLADLGPPETLHASIERLNKDIARLTRLFERGVICDYEQKSQICDATWAALEKLADSHLQALWTASGNMPPLLAMLAASGSVAKGQLARLSGIVGTVWSPWTVKLPAPVLTSFGRGVDPLGYFQLAAVARRKRVGELIPSTAPRRLQRRIASALGDVVVTEEDCGAREGVVIDRRRDEATTASFAKLIAGRVSIHRVHFTKLPGTIVAANWLVTPRAARQMEASGPSTLHVRSPLTCRARRGVCRKCYGADPATGRLVDIGAAVGVKAALAIGPVLRAIDGLQAPQIDCAAYKSLEANVSGVVSLRRLRVALDRQQQRVVISPGGVLEIFTDDAVVRTQPVPHGAVIHAATGSAVAHGERIASWNPSRFPILAQDAGIVRIEQGRSDQGCRFVTVVNPAGAVVDGCFLPANAQLVVADGARVEVGAHIATYFLPYDYPLAPSNDRFERLKLLFESRPGREQALLSPIDGRVELKASGPSRCTILLHPVHGGEPVQFHIRWDSPRFIIARHGQIVEPGDPLTRGEVFLGNRVRTRGVDEVRSLLLAEIYARLAELKTARPTDDRPWELLVAQMLRYVQIESRGDTAYEVGQIAPGCEVLSVNRALHMKVKVADRNDFPTPLGSNVVSRAAYHVAEQQRRAARPAAPPPATTIPWPAGWSPRLMGVEELAQHGSFLTAGGFIPTREALIRACLARRRRLLEGVQESVVAGELAPAGSGWSERRRK